MSQRTPPTQSELPSRLQEWVTKEMGYRPRRAGVAMPTMEDYKELCRGDLGDVWRFVIQNVHSSKTVHKVKSNLLLHAQQATRQRLGSSVTEGESEREKVLRRRQECHGQLARVRGEIGLLERDVDRINNETALLEAQYQTEVTGIDGARRRAALLKVHSHKGALQVAETDELTQKVAARSATIRGENRSDQQTLYARRRPSEDEAHPEPPGGDLETAVTHDVRGVCEEVGTFLTHMLSGQFGADPKVLADKKAQLWHKVHKLLQDYPPFEVMGSLCIHGNNTVQALKEHTRAIDLQQELDTLKFRYQHGTLVDTSEPPSTVETVEQLLQQSERQSLTRFVVTQQSLNNAAAHHQRYDTANALLTDILQQNCRGPPGQLKLAQSLVDSRLQVAVSRRVLGTLQEVAAELQESIQHVVQERERTFAIYQQIKDFQKVADQKQGMLRVLVKHNMDAADRMELHRGEVQRYTQNIGGDNSETRSHCEALKDSITHQVDLFSALCLHRLQLTSVDGVYKLPVDDLSINRLSANQSSVGGPSLNKLLHTLEFPQHKSPECLLPLVVEMQTELADLQRTHRLHSQLTAQLHSHTPNTAELCERVEVQDQQMMEQKMPALQTRLANAMQAFTDCVAVRESTNDWWEQPARLLLPWVTVDDQNFGQWLQKWNVIVTRLQQL